MTHKTRGIVLRSIKYGETSLVVTVYTELFGMQTYMVNGVRSSKKTAGKANLFQPAAILDLVVYHHENKPMQRIKEFSWGYLYQALLQDVIRNSMACYMVELMSKSLKQPETNSDLFAFCEHALQWLDTAPKNAAANFSLFFTLQLGSFLGFRITDNFDEDCGILDLSEGCFVPAEPVHPHFLPAEDSATTAQLLKVLHPEELVEIPLNRTTRRNLLLRYLDYYALHIHDFGQLKTLAVLHEVL